MRSRKLLLAFWLLLWPVSVRVPALPAPAGDDPAPPSPCASRCSGLVRCGWATAASTSCALCLALPPLALCLFLPGRSADPTTLRRSYATSLRHYEGMPGIFWGGGNGRGDRLLWPCHTRPDGHADLAVGLRTANPRLLRKRSFALVAPLHGPGKPGDGYDGRTCFLLVNSRPEHAGRCAASARRPRRDVGAWDTSWLTPGDLTWIEADPKSPVGRQSHHRSDAFTHRLVRRANAR